MNGRRCFLVLLLAVAVVAGAVPATAQTDVTTARISGTVRDTGGEALPGVTVEAVNQATALTLRAVTDIRGFYNLINLPTGTYSITVSLAGFQPVEQPAVRLVLGSAPTVDFTLQQGTFTESVVVTSEVPLVEVTNTTIGTTILTEQLASMPLNGRNFTDLVLLTPESRRETQRGYIALSGQRGVNTNLTVDGVDFNNAFFGGVTGDAEGRAPLNMSQESVKEFSVITNGASAEFGRSGGGFVNVITKSGSNELHGSAFYYYQPQDLISDLPGGVSPADQEKKQYGASLGGPIVKDELFFFVSYDEQEQSLTVPIDSRVLDADIFAKYPILASGPDYVQTRDGRVLFGRLDYQLGNGHRIMGRANYSDYNGDNGTSGSPTRTDSYNGLEQVFTRSYVASYSGIFADNLINDLNAQYVIEDTPRGDKGLSLPEVQLTSPSARYGEVSFLPITSTNTRKSIGDTLSYMLGDHVLKAGFEYNDTDIDQIFKGNWRGVYVFSNKADLLAGRWNEYRQFVGLGGLTVDEAGRSVFAQKETAFFVQDQWYFGPTLTFSAGLRWEGLDNPNFGILNPDDQNPDGSFKLTRKIPDANDQWSPRLGLTWAPLHNTVFRASAGRYWSRTPSLLFAQTYASNGYKATQYNIRAGSGGPTDPLAPPWGDAWTPQGGFNFINNSPSSIAKPGVFTFDPDYTNAHTDRFTLEAERELWPNTALSFTATFAESYDLEYLTDSNLQYQCAAGGVGRDCEPALGANGMPKYSSTRPFSYYDRINTYASGASSRYWGLTAVLQRRFVERFSGLLAVTWSEDRDNDSNERNFSGFFLEDKNDLTNNWGWSDRDQRWKVSASGTWNTPWWGFVVSGLVRYNTGQPYTAFANSDLNGDGDRGTDRPTVEGSHFRRGSFRQPDYWGLDLRLAKEFDLGPGQMSVIAECFNCTDREQYTVTSTTWGTGAEPLASFGAESYTGTPRTIQLALRYDF